MNKKKKYAMLIMDPLFKPERDHATFCTEYTETYILTVRSPQEAIDLCQNLKEEGFGAIEVCGAFGKNLARQMYEAVGRAIPVSYVITPEDQIAQSQLFWSGEDTL